MQTRNNERSSEFFVETSIKNILGFAKQVSFSNLS